MSGEELPPSKLGTKEHWDMVYERENRVFDDVGDEGEVWFGESSVSKMRKWAQKHLPSSSESTRVLECGSGNGTLLLSFLTSQLPAEPQSYHLTGIDYSEGAVTLGRSIEQSRRDAIEDELDEDEEIINPCEVDWRVADLLRHDFRGETWDLVMDKGTFDALCLSDERVEEDPEKRLPSQVYPERISRLVEEGGFFLITSCNFTEEEIKSRYTREGLGLQYHSSVPHPSFAFGGKTGTTVCTVAFQKQKMARDRTTPAEAEKTAKVNGDAAEKERGSEDLYLCIDGGGTKTDVAIASGSAGIIARVVGRTGNMAEVGLLSSYETITNTVLDAIALLPDEYLTLRRLPLVNGDVGTKCPISFADIWVGLSGCDTPLDQQRMSALLSPFFSKPHIPILNDSHLLGGALLSHNCPWGIAVIAGTGSVVIALEVTKVGEVIQTGRRGGMGYLLGDEGSAYDIGKWAIKYAIDDYDSGQETEGGLAALIRAHFDVLRTSEILARVYDLDPDLPSSDATNERKLRTASLSRLVLKSYTLSGDHLAERALVSAAKGLVMTIVSLVRQTINSSSKDNTLRLDQGCLVMGGGVIRQSQYRRIVIDELENLGIVFGVKQVVDDVAGQAVLGLVNKNR